MLAFLSIVILTLLFLFIREIYTIKAFEKKIDLGNGLIVTDRITVQSKGLHALLSPNNKWLPVDIQKHGKKLEFHTPIISYDKNKHVEDIINKRLAADIIKTDDLYGCDQIVYFDCDTFSNFFTLTQFSSSYICGAAHYNDGQITYNFDLDTGREFDALDMFNKNDNLYEECLNKAIQEQLDEEGQFYDKSENLVNCIGDARLTETGLEVTFPAYYGPSPGGISVSVIIPYEKLKEFIIKDSLLWNTLHQNQQ